MDGAANSPQGMKIPGGLTSTPAQKSTIPLIMELSDDDGEEEGVEVIEDSDNDDGMNWYFMSKPSGVHKAFWIRWGWQ